MQMLPSSLSLSLCLRQVTYGSFDYTSLLYLSDYGSDFTGGRFIFMDENGNRTVEPRAGTGHTALWAASKAAMGRVL